MKTTFLSLFLLLLASYGSAQSNYIIRYDKPSDRFSYFETNYNPKGEKAEIALNGKIPKLKKGDIVTVEVTNYNPFLYYVQITSKENISKSGKSNSSLGLLSILGGGLSPLSAFMTNLPDLQSSFQTRGEESLALNESELEIYQNESSSLLKLVKDYENKYSAYQKLLAQLENENLANDVKSLINKIENEFYKNYYNPIDKIELLSSSSKLHFNKAGVMSKNVQETASSLEYEINKFKELLTDPKNSYTKKGMEELLNKLKSAEFTAKSVFSVSSEASNRFKVDEVSAENTEQEILVGLNYEIKFYKIKDLKKLIEAESVETNQNYVKYYYSNKFWNSKGEIIDTFCNECTPVLRAEGIYEGGSPRNLSDCFKDNDTTQLNDEAIGKWTFYSTNGNVSYVLLAPETIQTKKQFSIDEKKQYESMDLSQTVAEIKSIDLPVKGAITMNWSSGLYSVGAFGGRKNYTGNQNITQDSVTINQNNVTNSKICIGSQMVFNFNSMNVITPSINLGAAVDFWDDRDIHFLVGGGLKFKRFPYISLGAGLAFTRVNVLNTELRVNQKYDILNMPLEIQTKKYRPGFYVGINVNF